MPLENGCSIPQAFPQAEPLYSRPHSRPRNPKLLQYLPYLTPYGIRCIDSSLFRAPSAFRQRLESGAVFEERHFDFADGTIALLGNNDFSAALQFGIVLLVDFFAEDEHHQIGILLDRSRLAQVGELRPVIAAAALWSAA